MVQLLPRSISRVIFSRVAIITLYQGVPTLMFRTANKRRNLILEASLRVSLARDEITTEGDFMRRIYDLKLIRHQNLRVFSLMDGNASYRRSQPSIRRYKRGVR